MPRNRRSGALLLLAILVAGQTSCAARTASDVAVGPAALRRVLDRARDDAWFVRATTPDSVYEGRVRTPAQGRVWIGEATITIGEIERIERRASRGVGPWASSVTGGLLLGTAAWAAGGIEDNPRGENGRQFLAATAFALGAVGGYLIGRRLWPGRADWTVVWTGGS